MDMSSLGIAAVAAITVICYLVGLVSGLAATGVDQAVKQLSGCK